jgi:hypothetical protein
MYQQRAGDFPNQFSFDGDSTEWNRPANLVSESGDQIWFASDSTGLVVAGRLRAFSGKDYVELQISSTAKLTLPVIGWPGVALSQSAHCDSLEFAPSQVSFAPACKAFFAQQHRHQAAVRALFAPRFSMSQLGLVKDSQPVQTFREDHLLAFTPRAKPEYLMQRTENELHFELRLPWAALPPSDHLRIDRLYLRMRRCDGVDCRALLPSYARQPEPADIEVLLAKPMQYQVTLCDLPLWGAVGNTLSAGYFMPQADLILRETLALSEPTDDYFRGPAPNWRVPEPGVLRFDQQQIGEKQFICGPMTSLRNASGLHFAQDKYQRLSTANNNNDRELAVILNEGELGALRIHRLDARYSLVMEPPVGKYRTDSYRHCGGETSAGMRVWLLNLEQSNFKKLLEWRAYNQDCWGAFSSFNVSDDLLRVTSLAFENDPEKQTSNAFCFDRAKLRYLKCADN